MCPEALGEAVLKTVMSRRLCREVPGVRNRSLAEVHQGKGRMVVRMSNPSSSARGKHCPYRDRLFVFNTFTGRQVHDSSWAYLFFLGVNSY